MKEDLFPSGPWLGFYTYSPKDKHRMDLHLEFANGRIRGEGNDDVGAFVIRGRYDAANRECHWTKAYVGAHEVHYRGFREGKGIWGKWEIGELVSGGFHIWPRESGEGEGEKRSISQPVPIRRRNVRPVRLGRTRTK